MQVRPGYKHTEVGIIPEEWDVRHLQEVCQEKITYGIVQCGPHLKNGVPYIRVSDMDGPELDPERMLRTSPSIAARFARSTVKEDDLVYALRGKLGEVRQVRREVSGANLTQGTARLSPNGTIVSGYFLWAMRNPRSLAQAEMEAKGTTFREITLAELRHVKILVPPLPEQRSIATVLSDADSLIVSLQQLLTKKRQIKQGAMQQLLAGEIRLPGFVSAWVGEQLGNTFLLSAGYSKSAYVKDGGKYLIMDMGSVSSTGQVIAYKTTRNREDMLSKGDLIMPKDDIGGGNIIGRTAYIDKDDAYVLSDHVYKLTPKCDRESSLFYSYLINSGPVNISLRKKVGGSAQLGLGRKAVEEQEIRIPSTQAERVAISVVLYDLDGEIAALETKLVKARAIKEAMMQELLTGRIRLV